MNNKSVWELHTKKYGLLLMVNDKNMGLYLTQNIISNEKLFISIIENSFEKPMYITVLTSNDFILSKNDGGKSEIKKGYVYHIELESVKQLKKGEFKNANN